MDIVNAGLSNEMRKIFQLAADHSKQKDTSFMTLESVEYEIVNLYLNGSGENSIIKKILTDLSTDQRTDLLTFLERSRNDADQYCPPLSNISSDDERIALSPELCRIFDRIQAAREVAMDIVPDDQKPKSEPEISIEEFFTAMLFERNKSNTYMINLGITTTRILEEKGLKVPEGLNKMVKGMASGIIAKDQKSEDEGSSSGTEADDEAAKFEKAGEKAAMSPRKADPNSKTPTIDQFGNDMTWNAECGKYDPVIGRDKEINQIIEILSCRKKCNAILLGEPGAGKSALVEGLAQKIVSGDVPRNLRGKKIVSISTTDLTAGTQYRGQLEERVMNLCKELAESQEYIVFLDEFHSATSENSTSIADMLKPSLSRGEITVIAATTQDEYKKFVEKDGALKRRFQKVQVSEPNLEETYKILKGLSKKYSEFHHVRYTDQVLRACAEYSERYMYDRKSPDRAIDIMDTSGALTKLSNPEAEAELEAAEKRRKEIAELKMKAISDDDLDAAKKYRDEGIELDNTITEIKKKMSSKSSSWPEVTIETVATVISQISGVAVDKIVTPEMDKIRGMKDDLSKVVIGQDEAIDSVVRVLSKSFLGLRNENRPVASLLFTGPSGVGKTLIAEKIAETIYGDKKALLRIDMGEYAQSHSVTKLLGSTASFVGYGDRAVFDQVRDRGQIVCLFDEIEKCNQEIINTIFLNIMDNGMIKLANGNDVSFRNAIIIFTSNEGTKDLELKGAGIGFVEPSKAERKSIDKSTVMKALEKKFRPEFRGRLTGITVFNSLGEPEMMKIFDLELTKFKERLKKKGYSLKVGKKLKEKIVKETDLRYGARDLIKGIGKYIEDEIVERMIDSSVDISGKKKISVDLGEEDKVTVDFA